MNIVNLRIYKDAGFVDNGSMHLVLEYYEK